MTTLACTLAAALGAAEVAGQVPITTASPEAREIYLQGRDAFERLRFEDARRLFARAAEKDPDFALAHLALANTAASARGFFDELRRAVALAGKASEGERHVILAQDAAARGDPAGARSHYDALVAAFPDDGRARTLLGNWHFGRQEYPAAIEQYRKSTALAPTFSQAWNQLGYAHRSLGQYAEAEKAFRRYAELIPDEPNPWDSQAELLMKVGRFQESIDAYRKALSVNPHFVASYVGIAHDQLLLGQAEEARRTLAKLRTEVARNDGERRQALLWTATSFVHEGRTAEALRACRDLHGVAEKGKDPLAMSGDLVQMGQILLHAGRHGEAAERFAQAVKVAAGADVPDEVKENVRRNQLYYQARVAIERGDLKAAAARSEAYRTAAAAKKIPFELRRIHELAGLLALHQKSWAEAVAQLEQAGQQDPEVLFHLALAHLGRGDAARARQLLAGVADFNELNLNWAFVRARARKLLEAKG
ncbi:MAG TPA: tetratricopeptide repeat protein [Anaeromyxobacteraceae bacterium]